MLAGSRIWHPVMMGQSASDYFRMYGRLSGLIRPRGGSSTNP